jgi:hypothetical protein
MTKKMFWDLLTAFVIALLLFRLYYNMYSYNKVLSERNRELDSMTIVLDNEYHIICGQKATIDKLDTIFFYHFKLEQPKRK